MAAGPATRISDIIEPEIFTAYTQNLTTEKSRIVASGMMTASPELDQLLAGGGLTFNVPAFRDLDNDAERTATDASAPFNVADASVNAAGSYTGTVADSPARPPNPNKTGTFQEIAVRMNRNNSWSSTKLAAVLAGADPMESIASRVAAYWTRRLQAAFVATWNGVIANNVAGAADFQLDISGASFSDGVTNFSAEAFLDAALTMGDSQDELTGVIVHSVVYNRMQKNNLIDFIPDARGEIQIPTFLGREVIVDDGMPRTGSVYDTWIFGAGVCHFGQATRDDATEMERIPGAGNGDGQDVLHNRVQWCIHPEGHAFTGSNIPKGGPQNTGTSFDDLDEAGSWTQVYPERKQIKFARLVTREA